MNATQKFPKGWDESKIQQLIAECDAKTEDEWVESDEAAAAMLGRTQIVVPDSLLPAIRQLLANHESTPA